MDHFFCAARGRTFYGDGRYVYDAKKARPVDIEHSYCGGIVFVDAASGHIAVEFQTSLTASETIKAIQTYEDNAKDQGIIVKEYQFDSGGAFTSNDLKARLATKGQKSRFSAPGSHHQNGQAERAIRTVMAMARTMLIHQAAHWQQKLDTVAETSR